MSGELSFDWSMYGMLVRLERVRKGYRKAVEFSKHVNELTGFRITQETIYKIEQGKQIPNAMQFMALNLCVFGEAFPESVQRMCLGITGEGGIGTWS